MLLKELLTEKFFQSLFFVRRTKKVEVPVFKNPSKSELQKLARQNDVRGFIWKGDVYIWDAEWLHAEVVQKFKRELGIQVNFGTIPLLTFFPRKAPEAFLRRNKGRLITPDDLDEKKLKALLQNFPEVELATTLSGNINMFLGGR